jgi:hypothetical protein
MQNNFLKQTKCFFHEFGVICFHAEIQMRLRAGIEDLEGQMASHPYPDFYLVG